MGWRVPFVDFPEQFRRQEAELMSTISSVLAGGDLIMRRHLADFEDHLAQFVGTSHAVGVSNCTDAIRLVGHALEVGAGDEVVSVAHTFVATISPFRLAGATPILIDVGEDHNMDPVALDRVVNDRTRVVVPVHLNGRVCSMEDITAAAQRVGAVVLEDAAQAIGARYRGQRAGTFGKAAVYSFYPAKLLGALGDGGAMVTDDQSLADEVRALRDHSRTSQTELGGWGYNCRLDNLQAAVLDLRLRKLPAWIERRRELAWRYHQLLSQIPEVRTPPPPADGEHFDVFQNYPVQVAHRDELVQVLAGRGVETLISWPVPLHHQKALGLDFELPKTEEISRTVVSLPLFPELSDEQVDYAARAVADFYA
jgi:dTDP-4-amino-4,6-dideoxygalactose transaminase